jgi:Flp pilus assembly protein CpaB
MVVSAAKEIPKGVDITKEMLMPKSVPRQFIPSQALRGSDDVRLLLGRKARYPIQAGQVLTWSDLEPEKAEGLSAYVPEGQRAFTITISKGLKLTMLQPGDHIDILGSFAAPKPNQAMPTAASSWRQSSDMVNVVLLQNVTILAMGEQFGGSTGAKETSAGTDITLSLTLQEAQMLMFASEHGELGAVLRRWESVDVQPRADLPKITFAEVEKIIGDLDDKRNYRTVDVQHGTKTTPFPVTPNTHN